MKTTHFNHQYPTMNFKTFQKNSRSMRNRSNFKKTPVKRFVEQDTWVKPPSKEKSTFNKNTQYFPTLTDSSECAVHEPTIKYGVKHLFEKRKLKKKSKKQKVLPGWVRIYFDKTDNYKIKTEYGPDLPQTHDYDNELRDIRIQEMILRHEMYQEWDDLDTYVPYWKVETMSIGDEYYSESESEDYYEEDEYSDDSDSYDYLV